MGASGVPTTCPACDAPQTQAFYHARLPADVGHVYPSMSEAREAPYGDVALHYCPSCSLIHNALYDPALVSFLPGYEISLTHSGVFREFIDGVAARLVERYALRGRPIIELGCGHGEFLGRICALGGNHGVGFDPSLPAGRVVEAGDGTVNLHNIDYLAHTESAAALQPALICCLSMFEAIERPAEYLRDLRAWLGETRPALYFEVFNGARALGAASGWSVLYEQCNYWGVESLRAVFEATGFEVLDAGACYGDDEYVYVEARPRAAITQYRPPSETPLPGGLAALEAAHAGRVDNWRDRLERRAASNERVCVWGTGGKGVSFLSSVPPEHVDSVIDINPDRQARYVPGSAHEILPPEALRDRPPELVVLTNPLYGSEIRSQVASLGIDCEFAVA